MATRKRNGGERIRIEFVLHAENKKRVESKTDTIDLRTLFVFGIVLVVRFCFRSLPKNVFNCLLHDLELSMDVPMRIHTKFVFV